MDAEKSQTPYLAGRLLLAMPGMGDPRFQKAVIFMCAHDPNGAMGIVVNQKLPGVSLTQLIRQFNLRPPGLEDLAPAHAVMSGGPVETTRGFILHSPDFQQPDTIRINDHFSVTGTLDALQAVANGRGPAQMLFALGYAGWTAGQLDREIQDNAWLVADAPPALIFDPAFENKWELAIRHLGIDPLMLSSDAGHA